MDEAAAEFAHSAEVANGEPVPSSYPFVIVWIHPETMVRADATPSEVLMKHWETNLAHARAAESEPHTYAAVLMAVPVPVAGRVVEEIEKMMRAASTNEPAE